MSNILFQYEEGVDARGHMVERAVFDQLSDCRSLSDIAELIKVMKAYGMNGVRGSAFNALRNTGMPSALWGSLYGAGRWVSIDIFLREIAKARLKGEEL